MQILYHNRRLQKWKKPRPPLQQFNYIIALPLPDCIQCNYIAALPLPTSKQPTMVGVAFSISEVIYYITIY
jgi:hypothetical protein